MQASGTPEQVIWEGSPTQWLNFRTYFLSGAAVVAILAAAAAFSVSAGAGLWAYETYYEIVVLVALAVPLFFALRRYLQTRFTRYRVTTERVRVSRGIFNRRTDDTELYRVDDLLLVEPFLLRLVRRGNVVLMTSDRTSPSQAIAGVPKAADLWGELRKNVEICRARKQTRVVDFQ